ncbi:MAG: YfhO family protein [Prevotella sp.]|nr:YfhO family protein [Prevotella sp.]
MKQMKTWLPDVVVVVVFALLAFAYFFPADIEGRVLNQGDISAGMGAVHEEKVYLEKTGERTRWTNALFSGMPTYQLSPSYDSTDTLTAVAKAYHLWLPDNVWYLFVYLLGFYILLRAFDFRWHLAALGSIMWAFSTYFLIIIAAGHIWKVMALAYLPPMIGGIVLAYRGKYLWGMVVTALFAALEVHANHVQMTYYYLLPIVLMIVAFAIDAIRQGRWAHLLKATGAVVLGGLLGVLVNSSNLYHTWRYSKETMRGKSELVKEDSQNQTSSGLERSYITDYSYGIGETWTLLVPNTKGGTSMRVLGDNEAAKKEGESHAFDLGQGQRVPYSYMFNQMPQYWEESMEPGANGTMGPVYVGAFVLMLFVLGLFIVRGPMKWALLVATVLSIMLAWGKHFMGLTDLFIDYVPMYAKFRAVESILVIAEFCIPLLAMLTLKRIVDEPEVLTKQIKWVYTAFALTGGMCLLFALMPTLFFDFTTQAEQAQFAQMLPPNQVAPFMESLSRARQAVFTADCWRSLAVIVVGVFILLLFKARKLQTLPMVGLLALLCLVDLWSVNKRYLNDAMFKPAAEQRQIRPLTDADRTILADTTLDYRVLNLAGNVFNENETSYYHKSVGGYHAAKLRRYQELIEAYISQEMSQLPQLINDTQGNLSLVRGDSLYPVLNMLNTKYLLAAQQNLAVKNPWAQGNAWFIDRLDYVGNANEELDGIAKVDVSHEAVADRSFEQVLGQAAATDSTATVTLLSYEPNELKYTVESQTGGVVVFSEIYYPDWTATIDGEPTELGRVNYVLRAMRVGPGRHEVVMSFRPKSIDRTETIAYVALGVLLLVVVALVVNEVRRQRKA